MKLLRSFSAALAVVAVVVTSTTSFAVPVRWAFSGHVASGYFRSMDVEVDLAGEAFSGSVLFDPEAGPASTGSTFAGWTYAVPPFGFAFEVAGYAFEPDPGAMLRVGVGNEHSPFGAAPRDEITFSIDGRFPGTPGALSAAFPLTLSLRDDTGSLLGEPALSPQPPDLGELTAAELGYFGVIGCTRLCGPPPTVGGSISGVLDTLVAAPVPEAGASGLVALGMAAVGLRRWRATAR